MACLAVVSGTQLDWKGRYCGDAQCGKDRRATQKDGQRQEQKQGSGGKRETNWHAKRKTGSDSAMMVNLLLRRRPMLPAAYPIYPFFCIGCVAYGKEEEPAEKERKEELRLGEFVWFSTSSCVALCLSSVEAKIDAEANANVPVRRGV